MIDFVKVLINRPFEKEKCNFSLQTKLYFNDLGEENKLKAKHKIHNLEIKEFSRHFIIQGSLHKFWNKGQHNHNDFQYKDLIKTLHELEVGLNLKLDEGQIQNLEYGLNITPPILKTEMFLRGLILHKGKPTFNDNENHFEFKNISVNGGDYRQVKRQQFYLKYYDKAKQYGLNNQILRIETKYVKSKPINSCGVYQLKDLLNIELLENLHNDLIKKWNEVLFINQKINDKHLAKTIKNHFKDFTKQFFWLDLYEYSTKQQRQYYFSLLDDLNQFYGGNIKEEVKRALNRKFEAHF